MYPGYTRTQPPEYAQALAARDLQEMSSFRDIGFRRVLKKKKSAQPEDLQLDDRRGEKE